eukprot:COSAG01_NODE_8807_length_2652_cov_1.825695_2_plen_43_part_00
MNEWKCEIAACWQMEGLRNILGCVRAATNQERQDDGVGSSDF